MCLLSQKEDTGNNDRVGATGIDISSDGIVWPVDEYNGAKKTHMV